MPNDKPLKIFSKSGKRLKDEEKRMYEMNKSMEEAAIDRDWETKLYLR